MWASVCAAVRWVPVLLVASVASAESLDDVLARRHFHGVTAEVARDQLPSDPLPELHARLADPVYPHRDSVLAYLAWIGDARTVEAVGRFLSDGSSASSPEELRAVLLAPAILGEIARRGESAALEALLDWTGEGHRSPLALAAQRMGGSERLRRALHESALQGLARSGASEARGRLVDLAFGRASLAGLSRDTTTADALRMLRLFDEHGAVERIADAPAEVVGAARFELSGDTAAPPVSAAIVGSLDGDARVDQHGFTFANHVDMTNPMTDARLDQALTESSNRAGRADYDTDVACCVTAKRSGTGRTFGSPGDGLDVITTSEELSAVITDPVGRFKVVTALQYCAGQTGYGIIGCGRKPGTGIVVVRMSGLSHEGILWLHEYGHNVGMSHASDNRQIMYGSNNGSNNGVSSTECNAYHNPSTSTSAVMSDVGRCEDLDVDVVHDVVDNCTGTTNPDQADPDLDGRGTACDNCASVANADQLNSDTDASGNACDPDDDNDGVADASDCAPLDPTVGGAAGPANGLGWSSKSGLTWQRGVGAETSNVYRNIFDATFEPGWTCKAAGLAGSSYTDTQIPVAGTGYSYLVTAKNRCGESSAGTGSDGGARVITACP